MGHVLDEAGVRAAELAVSHCFEAAGMRRLQAKAAIQYAKSSGLHRAEIKEARKRLGVVSVNEEGVYWWIWPDGTEPGEVNRLKSEEWFKECEKKRLRKY